MAARTGSGYYYGSGNSQGASNNGTSGSGSTNSVTATTAAIRGAVAYDWFYSANGSTWYYYTTTTTNTVTITSTITSNNALPSSTACPDLSTSWKGAANAVPTYNGAADNGSANANDYDGFLASLSGDYNGTGQWVQPGTGTANPSVYSLPQRRRAHPDRRHGHRDRAVPLPAAVDGDQVVPDRADGQRKPGAGNREPDPGFV